MSDGMSNPPDGSAADGCEIDIFESFNYNQGARHDAISHAVHYDGYGDGLTSVLVGVYKGKNIYTEYNTYGLEWNENELIFTSTELRPTGSRAYGYSGCRVSASLR